MCSLRSAVCVPFIASDVAEPPIDHQAIPMLSVLPEAVAQRYARPDALLLPESEIAGGFGALCRRFDKVMGPKQEWRRYLSRPEVWPLWELAPEREALATLSVAAVEKKSGTQLRKMLMSVPFNTVCTSVEGLMDEDVDYGTKRRR